MKKVVFLAAVLTLALMAAPANAQGGGEFCGLPEGCDLDGDGVAETPAGAPVPTQDQYGPDDEFCGLPEGCGASAPPDASASPGPSDEEFCALPEGCDASASPDPAEESPASPDPGASPPTGEGGASADPAEASPSTGEGADGGSGVGSADEPTGEPAASPPEKGAPTADLTVLPETGGASPTVPGLGILLVAGGLLVRGLLR